MNTETDWQEKSRQYAESKMGEDWDRHNEILVAIFYSHFIFYIAANYNLTEK